MGLLLAQCHYRHEIRGGGGREMKDWKERVTSNRKLAAINASAGSHPAMPFGRRPGGERAPVASASQKTQPQALARRYCRPLG